MPTIDAGGWVVLAFMAALAFLAGNFTGFSNGARYVKRRLVRTHRKLRRRYATASKMRAFNEGREFQKRQQRKEFNKLPF